MINMADPKDTVYKADPHTKAKHAILGEYLKRWLPILSNQARNLGTNRRLLYVDGFAGAGEYRDDVPGSPLVAIKTVAQHSHQFNVPIEFIFIEKRKDRIEHLRDLISTKKYSTFGPNQLDVKAIEGECEAEVLLLIEETRRKSEKLGPALFFLDQFGYSSFSMNLVRQILHEDVCEVFSYLNWNLLHPFMTDDTKWAGINKAFGGEEWKSVLGLSGHAKEERFRDVYTTALQERGGAKYTFPFAMKDFNDRVIYWLFFSTNNIHGLEAMKKAMWAVDRSGGFEFSDKHSTQLDKMFPVDNEWLANHLFTEHRNQTMTVGEIKEYVLTETPCHTFKDALAHLERNKKLKPVNPPQGRKRCHFPDEEMKVHFVQTPKTTQGTLFE